MHKNRAKKTTMAEHIITETRAIVNSLIKTHQ